MSSTIPLENFDTLANGMAHAIRNPLSSILTASTLVAEDPNISEETQMLLEVIVRESRHLNRIFSDFLEYVRPVVLNPTPLDLAEMARRTATQLQRDGLLQDVEYQIDGPLEIYADEDSIAGALRQLMLNAAEAMTDAGGVEPDSIGSSGKLRVSGHAGESVNLLIEDSGSGLTERQLARGFEPFFSDTADGTGLGLPLAHAAVAAAGGTLTLQNREDCRGAQAVLTFPNAVR